MWQTAGGRVMAAAAGPASEGRGPFCAGRSRPRAPRPSPSAAAPGPSGAACAPRPGPAGGRAFSGLRRRGAESRPGSGRRGVFLGHRGSLRPASGTATTRGLLRELWPWPGALGSIFRGPRVYGGWGGRKMSVLSPGCQAHLFLFSLIFGEGSSPWFFLRCAFSQLPPHRRSGD